MNNTTINSNPDQPHVPSFGGFTYGMVFTIGMLFLILVILFACARLRLPLIIVQRWHGQPSTAAVQHSIDVITEPGIDDETLQSYPKLLYSEVQKKNDDDSSVSSSCCCSICLVDYKETDVLRMLPDCGHLFHLSCIDSWLKLHPTCPICRSSSAPAVLRSSGVREEEDVAVQVE